jgi:cysteine synthase A
MEIRNGFISTIGNTPLLRLRRASEMTGCEILGKAEFLNPGGSVKDRAALFIVKDAEERGLLRPGGVIVEGTAGNTGIGLALVANARGYRSVIVIPDTQSQEKKDILVQVGAELRQVPAVPYASPNNYVKISGRLAEEIAKREANGAIWANQFDNVANRRAHYETTGPEIWQQTEGKVDGFICAVGTGGTLAGTAMYLRERNPKIRIGLADPKGAALYHFYAHGSLKSEGSSITEGIGQGRITKNLEGLTIDAPYQIPDEEAVPVVSRTKGCSSAGPAASMSPAPSAWRASSDRATRSSRSSPTAASATRASCSIPSSCAPKACRHPPGSRRRSRFRWPTRSPEPGRPTGLSPRRLSRRLHAAAAPFGCVPVPADLADR